MEQLQALPSLLVASDVPQRARTEGQSVRTTPFFRKRMYCSNYVRMQISFAIRNAEVSAIESAKCIGIIRRCVPFHVNCVQYRSFRIKESPLREVPLYLCWSWEHMRVRAYYPTTALNYAEKIFIETTTTSYSCPYKTSGHTEAHCGRRVTFINFWRPDLPVQELLSLVFHGVGLPGLSGLF